MATRTATSRIEIGTDALLSHELTSGVLATANIGKDFQQAAIPSGVSDSQANRAWERLSLSIASGATRDLDLATFAGEDIGAGAGRDGLGQTLAVEEIVCLVIKQTSGPGRLEIMASSPAGALAWIPTGFATLANNGALKAGGLHCWFESSADALPVEDGVSHVLRLGALNGNVVASVFVLGRHDDEESSSSLQSSASSPSSLSTSSVNSSSSLSGSTSSESSINSSSCTSTLGEPIWMDGAGWIWMDSTDAEWFERESSESSASTISSVSTSSSQSSFSTFSSVSSQSSSSSSSSTQALSTSSQSTQYASSSSST